MALLIGSFLIMGAMELYAAKAPLSQEELEEQSEFTVTGKVIAVESKVRKSEVEQSIGIHRDRVYTIRLEINTIHKMCPDRAFLKDNQVVEAWQPAMRFPPLPGLQGHNPIPGKGDTVTMYLKWDKAKKLWEPLLPNGVEIKKKAPAKK